MASCSRSVVNSTAEGDESESKEASALDIPASYHDLKTPSELLIESEVVLQGRLWSLLPEAILDLILMRLPPAAKCRFRSVCWKWKHVLSSSLVWTQTGVPCTIMTGLEDKNAKFFCHSEKKWFSLPFNASPSEEMAWEVVDTEAGIVCYRFLVEGKLWLSVSNPLTHSARIISPSYPHGKYDRVKLLVDQERKTFKVLVLNDKLTLTEVYDSVEASWDICASHPRINLIRRHPFSPFDIYCYNLFVWRNVIYAYPTRRFDPFRFAAFNMELGQWVNVKAKLPFETRWWIEYFILSGKDKVIFLQYCSIDDEEHVLLWRLRDKGLRNADTPPVFSRRMWKKINIKDDIAMDKLFGRRAMSVTGICYHTEHICFIHHGYMGNVPGIQETENCLKYSFITRSWDVMPPPACETSSPRLYSWEPSLDIDVELNAPAAR